MSIEGWGVGQLGKICSISIGGTPSRANPVYWDVDKSTDNLWVSIRDLNQRVITDTAEYLTDEGLKHSNVKELQSGTVLLSFKLTIGRVAIAGKRLYTNEAIAGLVSPEFAPDFLYYGLQQWDLLQGVDQAIKGATLNKQKLNKIEFNYPESVEEQAQIAAVLSTIDRAIAQTEAIIAKQQRIKTGLMQDLLTKGIDENGNIRSEATHEFKDSSIGRIPVEWEVENLGQVISSIISGWSPNCDSSPAAIDEWAILKTTAVVWSGYDPNENKKLPSGLHGIESIAVQIDDILITRKGPMDRVGVVVNVDQPRSRLMIPDTVFKIRLLENSGIIIPFLPYALGSNSVQSDWFQKKIGLADAQVNLNHPILRSTLFPKPGTEEQQRIVDFVKIKSKQLSSEVKSLSKLYLTKTGLMQDLLTGKVRVTPLLEKEPASR